MYMTRLPASSRRLSSAAGDHRPLAVLHSIARNRKLSQHLDTRNHDPSDPLWRNVHEALACGERREIVSALSALIKKGEVGLYGDLGETYERGATEVERDVREALNRYRRGVALGVLPIM